MTNREFYHHFLIRPNLVVDILNKKSRKGILIKVTQDENMFLNVVDNKKSIENQKKNIARGVSTNN